MPRQSQSNGEVVVLGGGRGLASVLRALRDEPGRLTAIVSVAYEESHDADARLHRGGVAADDLRRSLEALASGDGALVRVIRRSLTLDQVGPYALGNLVIAAVAGVLGDYSRASAWLGEQLGIRGEVLTATAAPVQREIESSEEQPADRSPGSPHKPSRVRFIGGRVHAPGASIAAIKRAGWVFLAPGSLYRGVLSAAAVPDLACALRTTRARVLWIANLDPGSSATDHLLALRLHGIRVDAVMHDPSAFLTLDPSQPSQRGVESLPRELRSSADPAVHDPERLRLALSELIGSRPARMVRG